VFVDRFINIGPGSNRQRLSDEQNDN